MTESVEPEAAIEIIEGHSKSLEFASHFSSESDIYRFINLFVSLGIAVDFVKHPASPPYQYEIVIGTSGNPVSLTNIKSLVAVFNQYGRFVTLEA